MTKLKNIAFGAITFSMAAVLVEGGLSALYYQMNDEDWAIERAGHAAADVWERSVLKSLSKPLDMPADVLESLRQAGGIIENARNPTGITIDQSPIRMADEVMGYKLRPNVKIRQHMVTPTDPGNLDPPIVIYDVKRDLPDNLVTWLKENSSLVYDYTTDSAGRRVTLPVVSAEEKIIVAGDSVTFGVGVGDSQTMASHLQAIVGESKQVINLGVGGYKAWQAYQAALDSPDAHKGNVLIYIACQNDFDDKSSGFDIVSMEGWTKKFAALKTSGHYSDVVIVLQSYQQFSFHHFLNRWPDHQVRKMADGFSYFDKISTGHGFTGVNWNTMLKEFNTSNQSLFAGMSLYADHVHLSPLGNRLLAERLHKVLQTSVARNSEPDRKGSE